MSFYDWLTYNKKTPLEKAMYKKAAGVAEQWKQQYLLGDDTWYIGTGNSTKEKYNKLVNLGKSPTPEQISKVIGNNSWTHIYKHEHEELGIDE